MNNAPDTPSPTWITIVLITAIIIIVFLLYYATLGQQKPAEPPAQAPPKIEQKA